MPRKSRMDRDSSFIGVAPVLARRVAMPAVLGTNHPFDSTPAAGHRSISAGPSTASTGVGIDGKRTSNRAPCARLALHRHRAAAGRRDPADDGQAQPHAGDAPPPRLGRSVERLEDVRQVLRRDPRPAILDGQHALPPSRRVSTTIASPLPYLTALSSRLSSNCPMSAGAPGSTGDPARRRSGRPRLASGRRPARQVLGGPAVEFHRLDAGQPGLGLGAAEEQQGLDDPRELHGPAQGRGQRPTILLARALVPQRDLELTDEHGQRRPQLVRGVAAESALPLEGDVQPGQQVVERAAEVVELVAGPGLGQDQPGSAASSPRADSTMPRQGPQAPAARARGTARPPPARSPRSGRPAARPAWRASPPSGRAGRRRPGPGSGERTAAAAGRRPSGPASARAPETRRPRAGGSAGRPARPRPGDPPAGPGPARRGGPAPPPVRSEPARLAERSSGRPRSSSTSQRSRSAPDSCPSAMERSRGSHSTPSGWSSAAAARMASAASSRSRTRRSR